MKRLIASALLLSASLGLCYGQTAASPTIPVPSVAQPAENKSSQYNLGEFITASKDKDLHYIKIEASIVFEGSNEKGLAENNNAIKEAITTLLMGLTIQKAKEEYISKTLQKGIQTKIEQILTESGVTNIKIERIHIPVFLVN